MSPQEPLRFHLPSDTVALLALSYEPYHWPALGKYAFQGGFSVQEPWEGHKDKPWYKAERAPYERLQALLAPHQDQWVEAECIAAFLPDSDGRVFSVVVNGVVLTPSMFESAGLRRRMLLQNLPILVTTCGARIVGGGVLPHGKKRGYGIFLDLKPFSR